MPINSKIKSLYDALKADGADVGSEQEFSDWFQAPGEQGYNNRKYVYDTFKADGADVGKNYEEFAGWLGLHAVQPQEAQAGTMRQPAGQTTREPQSPQQGGQQPAQVAPREVVATQATEKQEAQAAGKKVPVAGMGELTDEDYQAIESSNSYKPLYDSKYRLRNAPVYKGGVKYGTNLDQYIQKAVDAGLQSKDRSQMSQEELLAERELLMGKYSGGATENAETLQDARELNDIEHELVARNIGFKNFADMRANRGKADYILYSPDLSKEWLDYYEKQGSGGVGDGNNPLFVFGWKPLGDKIRKDQAQGVNTQKTADEYLGDLLKDKELEDKFYAYCLNKARRSNQSFRSVIDESLEDFKKALNSGNNHHELIEDEKGVMGRFVGEELDRMDDEYSKQLAAWQKRYATWLEGRSVFADDDDALAAYIEQTGDNTQSILRTAMSMSHDSRKTLEEAMKSGGGWSMSGFTNAAVRGIRDSALDWRTWTFGVSDLSDARNMNAVAEKFLNNQPLSQAEQSLLDQMALKAATDAFFQKYLTTGYKAGATTGEALPFILEMMTGAGEATQTAVKSVGVMAKRQGMRLLKRIGMDKLVGKTLAYMNKKMAPAFGKLAGSRAGKVVAGVGKIAKGVGSAAIRGAGHAVTTGGAKTLAGGYEGMTGQVDPRFNEQTGHFEAGGFPERQSAGQAFGTSFMRQAGEYGTEFLGDDVLEPILGAVNRFGKRAAGKTMEKLHLKGVMDFLGNMKGGDIYRTVQDFRKQVHYNGSFGEYLEEVANNVYNAAFVDDQNFDITDEQGNFSLHEKNSVFNLEDNWDTYVSCKFMSGLFGVANVAGYRTPKYRLRQDLKLIDQQGRALFANDGETWDLVKATVETGDGAELSKSVKDIITGTSAYNEWQRKAIVDYVGTYMRLKGIEQGEAITEDSTPSKLDEAFEAGYNGESPETTAQYNEAVATLQQQGLQPEAIDQFVTRDQIQTMLDGDVWSDEQKQATEAYITAKAMMEGMRQSATDEVESRVYSESNGGDGMIHPAVLKGEDEVGVNIVSGNVVTLADGTVDVANSDPDIVVVDANGERKMVSINDIASVGDVVDPNAVVDVAVQANAPMTGIEVGGRYNVVDEQNTQHEVEVLRDNGNGTVEVRVDGAEEPQPMVKAQLEQMLGVEAATMPQPTEQTAASPEATNDMVEADVPEAGNERYSVDPNADERAMGMAGFSEQDIAATVDYLNGKLGEREYLETVGISADTLDATSDEQIASWVNSIVERASEFITDATDEAAAVQPPTEQSADGTSQADAGTTATPEPIGTGIFGNIYDQFKGKVKEAIGFLLGRKEGVAKGALHHKDVGDIDLWYGNDGAGLKKIAEKHPEVLQDLQGIIDDMHIKEATDNRIILESDTHKAVVSKDWYGKKADNWLLTAYEKKDASGGSIDIGPEPQNGKQNGTAPLQDNLSQGKGSENISSVQAEDEKSEAMPMLEDGNPDYSQVDASRAHDYLYSDESGLDKNEADEYVQAQIDAAEKALSKIDKKPLKMGTDLAKYRAEKQRRQEQLDAAKANIDYWERVKAIEADREAQAAAERKAKDTEVIAQAQAEEQARQAAEIAKQQEQAERGSGAVHPAIAEKWDNAPKIEGYKDEVVLANGERVPGTYYLVESGAVTPSHNASREFEKYEGFPVDENGNTINDRDYERDKDAQNITRSIADKYDSRALQTPVIVSKDGVVLSGNGRTMAGELAASNNTDGAYIEHLKNYGRKYGFSPEQVTSMKHPRAVFVPDADMPYTTETFAKFNAQEMKGQSKTEQAVKLGKVVDDATFNQVVRAINEHETLGDFYSDTKAATEAINALRRAGAINDMQYAEMFDGDAVSDRGRQIIENMLIGKAFEGNPDVVRMLTEYKGFRQSVVTALNEISTNVALGKDYSLENELAQAVGLAYKARKAGFKENEPVSPYATQLNLFPFEDGETVADYNNVAVLELADMLNDKRPTLLKKKLQDYNQQSAESAAGQMDIFAGGVKEKKEIIKTVLNTLHNGETEETQRPEQRGSVADERGGEASLQEDGAADESSASLTTPQTEPSKDAAIVEASKATNTEPTDAQKEAGNYKKGHVKIDGFDISIEQPKGSVRSGVDASGKEWSQKMNNTYGYIRGTEGVDGDHIDVFLSDDIDGWNGTVYVVDQVNNDGSFDEHKVMYGFNSEDDARQAYLSNYEDGWQGLGAITAVSKDEFKKWIGSSHRKTKPFAEYKNVKVEGEQAAALRQPTGQTVDGDIARFHNETDSSGRTAIDEANYNADDLVAPLLVDGKKSHIGITLIVPDDINEPTYTRAYYDYAHLIDPKSNKGWQAVGDKVDEWNASHKKDEQGFDDGDSPQVRFPSVDAALKFAEWLDGDTHPVSTAKSSQKSEVAEAPKERIDDVGEKIEGAKKDLAQKMGERINLDADTFPKMFPKYDLKKLISQGLDPSLAVMTKMLRQMAQADYKHYSKKRMYGKSYALRASRFYAAYAKQVLEAGDSNVDFKSEGLGFTDYGKQFVELNKRLFEELHKKLGDDIFDLDLTGVKMQPISQKEGTTWYRRNQETGESEPYNPAYAFIGPRGQSYYEANELDKALQEGVEQVSKSIDYKKTHPYKLGHYYKPGVKNSDYVGVKLGGKVVPLTEPMTSSEVRKYMSEHNAELQAKAAQLDEQRKLDKKKGGTGEGRWKPELTLGGGRPRVGADRRGGVDIEAEEFMKSFGFRGVQFGNYVTQHERQRFLNEAYDALMDMAELLGISPRALAIDGRLGLAIGARGGGKANAHYEPKENVINLTKSKGAGSLAHEWFHALDYYFNRSSNRPTSATSNKSAEQFPASTRDEMRKAFLDLMRAIKDSNYYNRSVALEQKLHPQQLGEGYYDKPTELGARAFQDYVVRKLTDQGKINDFLSSFTSEKDWNGEPENYPYPVGAEAEKIDEKFDALFDAMQERTDEQGNTILYHLGKDNDVLTDTEVALRDGLVEVLRGAGIEVVTDEAEGQRVLDAAKRAADVLDEMKKRNQQQETALPEDESSFKGTAISSADGAKIQQIVDTSKDLPGKIREMRAWHGSGADFDAFDHAHMGEGEGAQAYGWGTYVTEVEGIARSYAEVNAKKPPYLSVAKRHRNTAYENFINSRNAVEICKRDIENYEKRITANKEYIEELEDSRAYILKEHGESSVELENWDFLGQEMLSQVREEIEADQKRIASSREYLQNLEKMLPYLESEYEKAKAEVLRLDAMTKRYLYEVEIPDNDGTNYLSWDEPLTDEQLERIASRLGDEDAADFRASYQPVADAPNADEVNAWSRRGENILRQLSWLFGHDGRINSRAASEFLHDCGFVGIEYPAQYRSGGRSDGTKNYVIFDEGDLKINSKTQFFRTGNGEVYGFVRDGKIYLDTRVASAETPVHEYSHLWADALKRANPEAWKRLKEAMLGEKDVLEHVKRLYPELEGDELLGEVFSHYSGKRGAERLRADMEREMGEAQGIYAKARVAVVFDKIRRALSRFWQMARDLFAGKNSMLNGMRAEDFADMAMADMLRGFDPRGEEKDRGETAVANEGAVLYEPTARTTGPDIALDDRFNKELSEWEQGKMPSNKYLSVGVPTGVLENFMPSREIILRQKVLTKALKKHGLVASDIKNLPSALAAPIFIFRSTPSTISVLTELQTQEGKNIFVAIELNTTKQMGHEFLELNDILTIHGREEENIVKPIIENNSLLWVDKEKGQHWLSSAKTNSQAITNDDLDTAAKIVKDFENPSIKTENYVNERGDVIRFESHAEQLSLFGGGQADALRQPTEQTAQRQRRASEMSDAELLSEMGRDIAELDKAGRADWGVQSSYSEEYDRRHIKEYNQECDAVRQMLDENNVGIEEAEQMLLDTIYTWREGYATADRSRLLAQFDTLNSYYTEKDWERDNADLVESEAAAMQQPTEQTADETGILPQKSQKPKRAGGFNPTEIKLRKLKGGETCYVERRYQESGSFDFTGSEKVESDADLAYIFRNLENSAIENTFLVLIKNGKATILHVGMGGYAFSPGHLGAGVLAASQLKPDSVIFVHNHPSGTLKPSQQDIAMQEKVKKMFGADKVREAIIIDITSGKYSIFDSDGSDIEKQRPTSAESEVPYKTYSFGQQVFAKDYVPDSAFQITDSNKAAEFISGHRLGERDKLSLIVLNRQKRVTGNIFLPWTSLDGVDVNKAADVIAKFIHQMGGESSILYGSGTISRGTLSPLARAIANYEVRLDDFINVEGVSAYQAGAMEAGVEYQPMAGNTGPANKDALESVAETNKIVEDLPQLWGVRKDFGTYHTIDSEEALENLISRTGLSKKDAEELRDAYYDKDVPGCGSPEREMVILFTEKFTSKAQLANIASHETFHVAYKYLERGEHNRFNNAILEWFRAQSWGDKFIEALHQSYDPSTWATETMAYFVGHEVEKHGWDKFISGEIDYGNEEINNFVSRFKNIITNGNISQISGESRRKALSDDERAGQRGRQPGQRGSNEQSDDRGWQRASLDLAREEGVGYGDADDSGISDEELAGYDAGRYSFAESITRGLVDLATKNAADQQLRMNAMREFGGNLSKLQRLMSKQRAYDKATVDDIVRLTRMVMGNGFFKDMRASEVKRLLAAIKKGVGAEDLTPIANNVVDMLVQHQLRESKAMLHKLMQVRGRKVDARGVEVQAGLDIDGQRMMSALKDGMSLGENGLLTRINDCENRLGSEDEVIRKNAMSEYQGLMLAKEYHDNILSGEEEEIVLKDEKRQEEEKIYDFRREPVLDKDGNAIMNLDGSVRTVERKTLKPEFKKNVTDENKQLRRNTEAAIERIEQSIRESRIERVTAYSDFMSDVAGDVRASRERAAVWRAEQQERIDAIHHNANSDLEGVPVQSQTKMPKGGLLAFNSNNDIVRLLFQPLATFEKMLRFFGRKSHNGEGYLFNRFMRGWADCSDKEWRSKRAAHEELDAKVRELFGKKVKRWSDLYEIERNKKHPGIAVEYWDNGERVQETMSQGEALSLVVWSKQKDAEAGLRRMGISEEDIETIKNNLDPKFLQLADWVVEEFLPKRREYYNEVHERMFGAPMAAIEHYFPIVRNSRDVEKPSDITERDLGDTKPSTITGNIIKRQRTAATLDVHTDFFDHLLKHLDDMENWAAWAEFNRDINTLRNYKRFKNRVLNMHSVEFGSGKDLWKAFDDACAIAAGVYHPSTKRGSGDNLAVNVAKGVTGAKIAFRFYTAAKQLLSLPAFWNGDAGLKELAKWENPVGAIIAWNWAMKNLPGFSKRWQSRQVGDVRLMDTDSDYAFWRNNMVRALSRGGMWANALVDGMTVAMGARAVYETKKKRYLRNGYSEEQAEKRAMQDAAINYNSSQQSSENAFLSSLQLDRTWWSTLMTVFRSASMGYQRRLTTGLRNLKNRMKKGYKAESIEFMKKQMVRDGIDEATAEKAARRTYRWGGLRSMADVFVFGLVLPFFWNLGPYALYLLMGDDDDEKKDMLKDAAVHSLFGPVEGLTGGQAMSEIGNTWAGYLMSDNDKSLLNALRYHDYLSMPLGSDLQQIFNEAGTDSMAAWTDAFNLLVQAGIGVNPETFTDAWVAIADACDGDPQTTKEFALCFMRVMQVPQTQVDKLFIDELGMTARDAQKLNAMEMADRYARYKKFRNAPLLNWAYSPDESQKVAEKYRKRFLDNMQERMERLNDEQLEWNFANPNDSERRKATGKAYAKGKGVKDSAGQKPASNRKPETRRSQLKYQRLRDWTDLAEDVLLDTAIEQAKNRGDDEKLKALRDAKKELNEIKRGKHTETWDVNGLGDGSAEDDKAIMDELRARRKELLRELGVI